MPPKKTKSSAGASAASSSSSHPARGRGKSATQAQGTIAQAAPLASPKATGKRKPNADNAEEQSKLSAGRSNKRKSEDDSEMDEPATKKSKIAPAKKPIAAAKKAGRPKKAARPSGEMDWSKLTIPDLKIELGNRGLPLSGTKSELLARLEDGDVEMTDADDEEEEETISESAKHNVQDWNKMKVSELKDELEKRGLGQTGKKADLVARLENHVKASKDVHKPKKDTKAKVSKANAPKTKTTTARKGKAPAAAKPVTTHVFGPAINAAPTKKLDVYVFGEGSAGELGLGALKHDGKAPIDVKRPRLNHLLPADTVGVVLVAVGGMHCAALTHNNKILTWGVNDNGALGREAEAGGKMVVLKEASNDEDSDSDSDDEDSGLNPNECEPRQVDPKYFPEGTKFTNLIASDSATFALTEDGSVYGWGNFRGNDGDLGFRPESSHKQTTPILIPELSKIQQLACGTNHVLALDVKGRLFTFGASEQNQMGRRTVSRHANATLIPREFGLQRKKIIAIGCGDYNSFCVDKDNKVYGWGLNAFGQTGIDIDEGDDNDTIPRPTVVEKLSNYEIKEIAGGAHHSLAITKSGEVLVWGSIQNGQAGMEIDDIDEAAVFRDEQGKPRYLNTPVAIPDITGASLSCGADHCLVITKDGEAWAWGFNENYQCGLGQADKIIEATHIDNSAVAGKKMCFVGAGGQFGVIAGEHETTLLNGATPKSTREAATAPVGDAITGPTAVPDDNTSKQSDTSVQESSPVAKADVPVIQDAAIDGDVAHTNDVAALKETAVPNGVAHNGTPGEKAAQLFELAA